MITEDDIRRTLRVQALDAPDLATVRVVADAGPGTARAHRSVRSLRPVLAGLAAVATVAAIAAAVSLIAGIGPGRAPAGSGSTAAVHSSGFELAYSYRVTAVPGYTVSERDLYADRQSVIFAEPIPATYRPVSVGTQEVARVDAYSPGQYDPTVAKRGTPLTVAGRPGFVARVAVQLHDDVPGSRATVPAIVWEYAPNAWAVAAGMDAAHQTRSIELAYAKAIVPGVNPLLLPAKLTTIPPGLVRSIVRVQPTIGGAPSSSVTSFIVGFKLPTTPSSAIDDDFDVQMNVAGAADVTQDTGAPASASGASPSPSSTDPVPRATFSTGGQVYTVSTVRLPGGTTMYVNAPHSQLSLMIEWQDTLGRTANLGWADFEAAPSMSDTSTWFDASVAIP